MDKSNLKKITIGLVISLAGLFLLGIVLGAWTIVPPGHRGVVVRLGNVVTDPLTEGLHFKLPYLDDVENWSVQVKKIEAPSNAGSADLQTVHTTVSVNYRLNPSLTPLVKRDLGPEYETNIIKPALQEAVKAVIARYQAEQLLERRSEVRTAMEKALQEKLNSILENSIMVSALNIEDFKFEDSFNAAIEAKQVAEQEAKRVRNEVARETAEADKQIEKARGAAQSRRLQAQGFADALAIESEARAKAIQVEAKALKDNPEVLRLRIIERWDGVMPRVVGDGQNTSFLLNLGSSVDTPKK